MCSVVARELQCPCPPQHAAPKAASCSCCPAKAITFASRDSCGLHDGTEGADGDDAKYSHDDQLFQQFSLLGPSSAVEAEAGSEAEEELDADVLAMLAVHHLSSLIRHGMCKGIAAPECDAARATAAMTPPPNASSGGELWCHMLTCPVNPFLTSSTGVGGMASSTPCHGHPLCAVSKLLLLHRLECTDPDCFLCTAVCEPFQRRPQGAHAAIGGAALPRRRQTLWRDVSLDGMDGGYGSLLPSSLLVQQLQALLL